MFISNALLYLGLYMVQPLVTSYVYSLGVSAATVGFVAGCFASTALLFKVVSAPASDTFRKELVIRFSLIIMVVAFAGYSLTTSIKVLVFFRLLQGVGQAFAMTCYLALAADTLPPSRMGAGIGIFMLASAASQAISPAVGLAISERFGFNAVFRTASALAFGAFCISFLIRTAPPNPKRKFRISLNNFIAREALLTGVLTTLLMCCFSLINSHLLIFAGLQGIEHTGYYFTVYSGILLITRPALGRLSDRYGSIAVLVPALLCFAASNFLVSFATNLPVLLLSAFVAAFGFGASCPVINSLGIKCTPPERHGAASSTYYVGFDLGNMLGPILAAPIIEHLGYPSMWRIMTVTVFAAIALLLIFRRYVQGVEDAYRERNHISAS